MRKEPKQKRGLVDYGRMRRILLTMSLLGFLAFIPICLRLAKLMIFDYPYYEDLALKNQLRTTALTAERGNIYDCSMQVLAGSVSTCNVYLDPRELRQAKVDLPAMAETLGEILEKDPDWILKKARNFSRRYEQIGRNVDEETGKRIRDFLLSQNIKGIHLEPGTRRVYPFGSLAAQVIGFTDAANSGVEGLELSYDSYLRGDPGKVITTKGNNEMDLPFSYEQYLRSRQGCSLVLTLDATVQSVLENQLQAAMDRYQVKNGSFGLVMNCKTGEILAMATLGSFDPNHYQEIGDPAVKEQLEQLRIAWEAMPEGSEKTAAKEAYEQLKKAQQLKQWRNRVISDGYEPGSTFKVLTMAAALDCGAITLDTDFYCRGAEQIPGRSQLLHCWRHQGHGAEKTAQALQNSCNIAFAHIALKLGGPRFYDYVTRFGIREKTGIDLKGESKGVFFDKALITDTDKWGTASLTSGSFGQTFKLTPIQLAAAISSVVNGGSLMEPYIVKEILDQDGNRVFYQEPTLVRRTISQETSETMRSLIRSVVTEGTAKNAAVAGYSVGGKTGTSEKIDVFDENGRRVQDKIVSFVGIAPMDDPEYLVLAALDTPSRNCGTYLSGGAMAAPTVGAILRELLPYLEVPMEEGAKPPVIMEDFQGLSLSEARALAQDRGLTVKASGEEKTVTAQIPAPGESLPSGSEILLYFGKAPENTTVTLPDFTGLEPWKAEEKARKLGLYPVIRGNTEKTSRIRAISQHPAPGEQVPPGTALILEFSDTAARD